MAEMRMFEPTGILPHTLGLHWGMSKEDCLRVLGGTVLGASETLVAVRVLLPDGPRDIVFYFPEHGGLQWVETKLCESRSFWDGDCTVDEFKRIRGEFEERHDAVVRHFALALGRPCFHGSKRAEGYPAGQSAEHLAYWRAPGARIQVELDHWDKELPFVVTVRSYPLEDEDTKPNQKVS